MRLLRFVVKLFVGLLAFLGLLVLAFLGLGIFALGQLEQVTLERRAIPERVLLTLDLARELAEDSERDALLPFLDGRLTLIETLEALAAAREDPRVEGLLLEPAGGGLGLAEVQELRQALQSFAKSGKKVLAFAPTLSGEQGDGTTTYYLASVAQALWMQPSGDLAFSGYRIETPYIGEALGELGIAARFDRREDFKGALEPLTMSEMSAPVRDNLQRLLDSWAEETIAQVAEARGLQPQTLFELLDRPPLFAEDARAAGLIDEIGYRDQALAALKDGSGPGASPLSLADYAAALEPGEEEDEEGRIIALVEGKGQILLEEPAPFGPLVMSAGEIARTLEAAAQDPEVAAIVFRIDSPGGSYVASDVIARAVARANSLGKPVVASLGNVAASGGYFVAAPAAVILAQPGSITGSIGVVSGKPLLTGLWSELEVRWSSVEVGRNAGYWSPNEDFSEEQWSHLQASLDRTYAHFLAHVAEARHLPLARLEEEIAGGRVWSGADAFGLGLVDDLGGLAEAVERARSLSLPPEAPFRLVPYPRPEGLWERFRGFLDLELAAAAELAWVRSALGGLEALLPTLKWIEAPQGRSLTAPLS